MGKTGLVALFGSGETSPKGGQAFEALARDLPVPLKIGVLETPAGFELNSPRVAGRVADFIQVRLQNYNPQIDVIPARKKGTRFSPDDADIVQPLLNADMIFLGPGSPTYAVRHLSDSLAWRYLIACHRTGATIAMASAATIASGSMALPVYEIYKVGEDPHWKPGLDFFAPYGLSLVFVPHWNNAEGGKELDTSHCFMGQERFDLLYPMLSAEITVVGIDEQTIIIFDFNKAECRVMGQSCVHVIHNGLSRDYLHGKRFPIQELGNFHMPEESEGIPEDVWETVRSFRDGGNQAEKTIEIPREVQDFVIRRQDARQRRDWALADSLRGEIEARGWRVVDTPQGPQVEPMK
jgi:hypothetical protein